MNETLLKALGAAMVALWAHGVWEYIQMVRHRKPGTSALAVSWAPERLTPTAPPEQTPATEPGPS